MDAAKILRTARDASGLTLRELADRAETSHSTLAAYEHGRVVPRVDTMFRIIEATGQPRTILIEIEGDFVDGRKRSRGDVLEDVIAVGEAFPRRWRGELQFPPMHRVVRSR